MKITAITLGRTINVGNYESVRLDLHAVLEEDESLKHALEKLKDEIDSQESKLRKEYDHRE